MPLAFGFIHINGEDLVLAIFYLGAYQARMRPWQSGQTP